MDELKENGFYEVCGINEVLARTAYRPRALFGDLWLEGEIAVMFGEAGAGKSVLAVQIAESIARGRRLKPMYEAPKRQKVVYLDLESLPEHFCRRYRHDDEMRESKPYRFGTNFLHHAGFGTLEPDIAAIGEMVKNAGARVLIIDKIARVMKSRSTREAERVMRELRRLNRVDGISILLLAHSAAASLRRGIEACDVPFAQVMSSMADNVFAIGRNGGDPAGRYIKHIRPGAAAHTFDASHVPWFRIRKRANFTYFDFRGFAREGALRVSNDHRGEWKLVERIRELNAGGMSVRDIARTVEMSKSSVHRYLTMMDDDEEFGRPAARRQETVYADPLQQAFADHHTDDEQDTGLWLPELDDTESDEEEDREPLPAFMTADDTSPSPEPEHRPDHPLLERDVDSYGKEIFVEKRDYHGKRLVWYGAQTNGGKPNGKYTRFVYIPGLGIGGETVECLPGEVRKP